MSHQSPDSGIRSSLDALDEALVQMRAVRGASGGIQDFECTYCNGAARGLLGRRREDVLGRRMLDLLPTQRTHELVDACAEVVRTGEPLRLELATGTGDHRTDFEVIICRADDGCVLAARDISEHKRVERDLAIVNDQLQTALLSRILIEQAKGFLAAKAGTNPEQAFRVIRRYARDHNLKLRYVCKALLAGELPELTDR